MTANRLFWLLVLAVGMVVLAIAVRHEAQTAPALTFETVWPIALKLALVLIVGSAAFALFSGKPREALRAAAFWVLFASLIALGYTYRHELQVVADRVLAELMPGHAASRRTAAPSIEVNRSSAGEFAVRAQVNGRAVPMVVDTGATSVVLTVEAAKTAGLPLDFLRYDVVVETANGRTRAAAVTVDTLSVGSITARRVPALVAEKGDLRTSLLGMTFLNRLESYEVRGNRLIMRGRPTS